MGDEIREATGDVEKDGDSAADHRTMESFE
jgi:hypothetical protein